MNQDTREQPVPLTEAEEERESAYSHGYGDGKRDAERAVHDRGDPLREAAQRASNVLDSMDAQASPPGPDHLVVVTVEVWIDAIRPIVKALRAALGEEPHGQ